MAACDLFSPITSAFENESDPDSKMGIRVQVLLRAKNLINQAGLLQTVSDPYAVIYKDEHFDPSYPEEGMLARTERIKDDLNPKWATPLIFDFDSAENETITICIYDHNSKADDVPMTPGISINLLQVIEESTKQGEESAFVLGGTSMGFSTTIGPPTLFSYAYASQYMEETVSLKLRARHVKNVEQGILGFGKTDPYLEIYKQHFYPELGRSHWLLVHRTECIHDHLNPVWKDVIKTTEALCDGDWDKSLKITLVDFEKRRKHRKLGHVETTLNQLKESIAIKGNGDLSNALTFLKDGSNTGSKKGVGSLIVMDFEEL